MKISVSLSQEDLAFLDRYAKQERFTSRSAALQKAVRLLRASTLESAYEAAWNEWEGSAEEALWQETTADGLES